MTFLVAGSGDNLRWAGHSCNGFSAGVDTDSFKGEGFESGFDPVWEVLLDRHEKVGLHAIVGGGDQIYCDSLTVCVGGDVDWGVWGEMGGLSGSLFAFVVNPNCTTG